MGGGAFFFINLFLILITAGAWFPITIIWAICRALSGGRGNVQVVVSNHIPRAEPTLYTPPAGYKLIRDDRND